MSLGGPGGEGDEPALFQDMNVTPLVDVVLVLLVIFMVTASGMAQSTLPVDLPSTAEPAAIVAETAVTVSIDARSGLRVGEEAVSKETLEESIRKALAGSKQESVVVAGDKGASLERMVEVIEAARRAGATRVAIGVAAGAAPPPTPRK